MLKQFAEVVRDETRIETVGVRTLLVMHRYILQTVDVPLRRFRTAKFSITFTTELKRLTDLGGARYARAELKEALGCDETD